MSEFLLPELFNKLEHYRIHLGVPIQTKDLVAIPAEPYVFLVKELLIYQGRVPLCTLGDVMVIHGHGLVLGTREQDWIWRGTKKSVSATVKAYEDIARTINWPHIDIILACRDATDLPQQYAQILFTRRPDIRYIYADSTIYQADFPGDRRLLPGQGVTMTVMAKHWIGIDAWQNLREPFQRDRAIPKWAKMPAIS